MKECIRGVKLLLDRSQDIQYGPAVESDDLLMKLEKKPVEVTADYLKKLVSHLKEVLDRRGIGCLMKTMDVHYTLTVPAVWSDKAKDLTMQAACQAGIPKSNLYLLSEPEAAAVHALRAIQPDSIEMNDCFIVCDAGGGTVKFLMETIGETNYMCLSKESKRMAMHRWINDIKPYFAGQDEDDGYLDGGYFVPVPGVEDSAKQHIKNGMLHLDSDHVQKIFDPVVSRIKGLIASQQLEATEAGSPPKAVILVGGLGSSEYLYKQLKSCFMDMEIMQPHNAWSAVVRAEELLIED
ncbi:Heat shock protein 70 family [Penicillium angulare]|uniref:Heat shock protein 70 family n=1 Tax=Penicillium angulare TaxID=116970 RepID=A0A9W9GDI2_9EURO|nr:Heat shock protein 70 family [Penicillium angulare]